MFKYVWILFFLVSFDAIACSGRNGKSRSQEFRDAMDKKQLVVVAMVSKKLKHGSNDELTLTVENSFNEKAPSNIGIIHDYNAPRSSCDFGDFHPQEYLLNKKYLFIIRKSQGDFYIRAGEELNQKTQLLVEKYIEHNTANKRLWRQ